MKTYDVTFTRFGFARIEAETEEEAWEIAKDYDTDDVTWSDDWEVTDVAEEE